MSDSKSEENQVITTPPGLLLKQARQAKGLSEEDIASRLHLRVVVVKQMEDDLDKVDKQRQVYLRGYMRNYAREVGLDPEIVPEVVAFKSAPGSSGNPKSMKLMVILALVAAVAGGAFWAFTLLSGSGS